MDDDLNEKINQVAEMLGKDEIPDNIRNIISMLSNDSKSDSDNSSSENTSNFDSNSDSGHSANTGSSSKSGSGSGNNMSNDDMAENIAMISKIKKIMEKTNGVADPKVNLLSALEPFLNGSRQDKLKNCMKILKMTKLTEVLKETDIL